MIRYLFVLLVVILFSCSSFAEEPIDIPDTNLKAAIEDALGVSDPNATDMLGLKDLTASEKGVSDLTGLEYATNLEWIYLNDNQISNISPLAGLTNLRQLYIPNNQIGDISPVSGLTKLWYLDIWGNQISDISAVSGLTNLQELSASNNQITNIAPVSGLTNLLVLFLDNNPISDISSLSGMTNLESLGLSGTQISNISPLEGLINLRGLRVNNCQISDISSLAELINLETFAAFGNQISDISPLADLTKLTLLDLWHNQIHDISPLSKLTNLQCLYLEENQVIDISPLVNLINLNLLTLGINQISDVSSLAGMTNLTELNLEHNQINDISSLSGMTNLQQLFLDSNRINDISPLSSLTNLQKLYLRGNQIIDISPFTGLTNLQELFLDDNQITDFSSLSGLTGLQNLSLGRNQITDLSFLSGFTNLLSLGLWGNQISDLSPLAGLTNLQTLGLDQNKIIDIEPLQGLSNLQALNLNGNQISDISPLTGLTNLKSLGLSNNPLSWVSYDYYLPVIVAGNSGVEINYDPPPPEPPLEASDPEPANNNNYAPMDGILSWTSGKYSDSHDVYFGTSFEDIQNADRNNPLGVLRSQDQSINSYNQGHLEFNQTYYWRIDEIQKMPEEEIYKGNIWSFTTVLEPGLVAYYPMDEDSGTIIRDATGNNHDGQIQGAFNWVQSMSGFGTALDFPDQNDSYVDTGTWNPSGPGGIISVAAWINWAGSTTHVWQMIVSQTTGQGMGNTIFQLGLNKINNFRLGVSGGNIPPECFDAIPPIGEWTHVAFSFDGNAATVYINGQVVGISYKYTVQTRDNANVRIGTSIVGPNLIFPFNGIIDEVYFWNGALTQQEIQQVMEGKYVSVPDFAFNPKPLNNESDVQSDVLLSWKHGKYTYTHNLFFGTDFNDVNNATVEYHPGVIVSESQAKDANTFDPGILEFGQTYYWRVDEVNSPLKPAIYIGKVWQFTTETYALKIPSEKITAHAISNTRYREPSKTIDESGLDPENMDLHSDDDFYMWLSKGDDTEPVWIKYDFDEIYKLYEMYVWNYNNSYFADCGFRDVTVEYSLDDVNWTELPDVPEFSQAPMTDGYEYNTIIDFRGILAKYVRLTANSNWSDSSTPNCGLSEIRFTYVPNQARIPYPATNTNNIPINVTLSWEPGREAAEHNIYFSSDLHDVNNSNIPLIIQKPTKYSPLSLEPGCTYYWRVDEVNEFQTPSLWQGEIWNFTTSQYLIIDDFEDYNDTESYRVFDIWSDGRNNPENGSLIGYLNPNLITGEHYLEKLIYHNGLWSTPITYDNSVATYSEISVNTNDLNIENDWTIYWPQTLVLWFYGDQGNSVTEQMYVKINGQKVYYDTMSDISIGEWKRWKINLATLGIDLSDIISFSIGFERTEETGGSGIIFVDDIRLYRDEP